MAQMRRGRKPHTCGSVTAGKLLAGCPRCDQVRRKRAKAKPAYTCRCCAAVMRWNEQAEAWVCDCPQPPES